MKRRDKKYSRDTNLRPALWVPGKQNDLFHRGFMHGPDARVTTACKSAFTLIEMLVATVLSAVLMSAVLAMLAGVSRDRKALGKLNADEPANQFVELIRWDLSNASTMCNNAEDQSIILIGLDGIDPSTLMPNGRLVQVTYQMQSHQLWRSQEYLDDPAHRAVWHELAAANVSNVLIDSATAAQTPVPSHVRLRFSNSAGSIDRVLWIK